MDGEKREKRAENPRAKANFLSALFFVYMVPIFWRTMKKGLTEADLFEPLDEHRSEIIGKKLETVWLKQYEKHKKYALHLALFNLFGTEFIILGILTLTKEVSMIVFSPLLIGRLITFFSSEKGDMTVEDAYLFGGLLVLFLLIDRMLVHPCFMWIWHVAMKLRVSCSSLIYRKTLRLSRSAIGQENVGHMVNLLSNDMSKFDQGFVLAHYSWVGPIQTAVGTYFIYDQIGVAGFLGVGFLLLFLPIQMWLGKRTSVLRLRTALRTDERVRLMNEIISGIQVIKMYTWEKPFGKLIALIRRKEIEAIRAHKYLLAMTFSFETFVSRAAIFISLVAYSLMGNSISASRVFAVTAIYNVMRTVITYLFSISISSLAEVNVSIKRIQQFLSRQELIIQNPVQINGFINSTTDLKGPRIILKNVSAKWLEDLTIDDVNLNIDRSQLFAVIGPVGAGKTSLLNVILKELPITSGELEVTGKITFSSQDPWLFFGSVRQNILFGDEYNERRYKEVCKVCALESDFALLPYGDRTLVGDKGKALSGGQKARVNLARCIYKKADIYLLDDPLSAVDAHVGKQLYTECIKKFLKNKIVILITHQLQYLQDADNILILKDGCVMGQGDYRKLQSSGLDFASLLEEHHAEEEVVKTITSRQNSISSSHIEEDDEDNAPEVEVEKMGSGVIAYSTYWSYIRAGGSAFVICVLFLSFVLSQVASNGSDYYITYWVNSEQQMVVQNSTSLEEQENSRNNIIYEYSGVMTATIILAISHCLFHFVFFMRASVRLHDFIFERLSCAKMAFFNSNPSGRILNRFSKDLGIIDEYIPSVIFDVLEVALLLIGTITLTAIVDVWLLIPAMFLVLFFYLFRIVFLKTSRSVKRIEGITRSPIFGHMTSTFNGLTTIRALSAQDMLIKEFDQYQNLHSSAWYIFMASTRAFGFWLDLICVFFIAVIIAAILALNQDLYGGDMGLIITQYMALMGSLQWGMRQWSELENQMTSTERILEYTKLESEPIRKALPTLNKEWPNQGKVEFKNLSLRYNAKDEAVLKNLNFVINAGEKIGIVGRTGAGKSSIIVALFQLYEIEGCILIDNVDTTMLPLETVRANIAIIPQEPVLFSGTMRKNLDPFNEYQDDVLWAALEQVELKTVIAETPNGLSCNVSEGGMNFSIGQRQLVCLARAIIRNNKILVLDEATANVDPHTDNLIQNTIRRTFADGTVLTIAHRLHTVMDSHKILVMDAGRVVEFNHPKNLLAIEGGIFRSMVEKAGIKTYKND